VENTSKSLFTSLDVELGTGASLKFKDVSKVLAPYVEIAVELNLVNGNSATTFAPNEKLSRQQAFVIAVHGIEK
jgi:hypothetical protein